MNSGLLALGAIAILIGLMWAFVDDEDEDPPKGDGKHRRGK